MPTLEENRQSWNVNYPWPQQGEEWSEAWGGSEAQWFGAILPRIQAFLPARSILEIGPGFGRWTHYLREHCDRLVGVDLAQKCIDACRQRFASDERLTFHANDGQSLAMVADRSIDFVFSFDTLVHAETDVVEAYLGQIGSKLAAQGAGFIHHSNLGSYSDGFAIVRSASEHVRGALFQRDFLGPTHWRAESMTAALFEQHCTKHRLQCISQELINWGTESLPIDCFSVFSSSASIRSQPNQVTQNSDFMKEAEIIKRRSRIYSTLNLRG